jgi:hypothetical protein
LAAIRIHFDPFARRQRNDGVVSRFPAAIAGVLSPKRPLPPPSRPLFYYFSFADSKLDGGLGAVAAF